CWLEFGEAHGRALGRGRLADQPGRCEPAGAGRRNRYWHSRYRRRTWLTLDRRARFPADDGGWLDRHLQRERTAGAIPSSASLAWPRWRCDRDRDRCAAGVSP